MSNQNKYPQNNPEKLKMVLAVSQASTMATLNKGQIEFYSRHGFDVRVFAAKDNTIDSILEEGGRFFNVNFVRALNPFSDVIALVQLIKLFATQKPQIIQLMTLKPSFLGTIAGRLTRVPVIIRFKWGNMRESNYKGVKRFLLFAADRFSNMLADRVVAICHKLKDSEIEHGVVNPSKIVVYGFGSDNGVDLKRFKKTPELAEKGKIIREKLRIWPTAPVLGTVMRINIEKGITELILAFKQLSENYPNLRLIIVGEFDVRNLPGRDIINEIKDNPRIHHVGFQKNVEEYYAAMDIFVMPSYREGFCKSNIEASSMELPVVSTDIIGCSESVKDGVSGILVPPRQVQPLIEAIEKLLTNNELAAKLAKQGRYRVETEFDNYLVWHNQLMGVCEMLKSKGLTPPVEPDLIKGSECVLCKSAAGGAQEKNIG
jgi:glycosyltransferase involved in cell wall biosynthesis